jgi:hypothetical protein
MEFLKNLGVGLLYMGAVMVIILLIVYMGFILSYLDPKWLIATFGVLGLLYLCYQIGKDIRNDD